MNDILIILLRVIEVCILIVLIPIFIIMYYDLREWNTSPIDDEDYAKKLFSRIEEYRHDFD